MTRYMNVDLDVYGDTPLDGLVQEWSDSVIVLLVGGSRKKYEAHVALASSVMDGGSVDETIVGLTRLVRNLPRVHRKTWNSATRREFNIGIEAGLTPPAFELPLQERTLKAVIDVGGVVVVTVYAPDRRKMTRPLKRRPGKDSYDR